MTTQRSRRLHPELRVRRPARQSRLEATLARADGQLFADTARRPDQDPSDRVLPAAPTPSTKSPVQTPRTQDARTPTPDTGRPHPDIGQPTRGHRIRGQCTGHRTPDTGHRTRGRGRVRRQSDLGTADIRTTSWTPRPPACPLDAEPWTCGRRLRRSATMTGSATVRYLPARDYSPHYQAPARSLRRPSRALAHCFPQKMVCDEGRPKASMRKAITRSKRMWIFLGEKRSAIEAGRGWRERLMAARCRHRW
jgi:hypothetical protein